MFRFSAQYDQPSFFMAKSKALRRASLPKANRSSLKSPSFGTRHRHSTPNVPSLADRMCAARSPAASLSRATQMRLIPDGGMKRPRCVAVRQDARLYSRRAVPTDSVFSRPSPTIRSTGSDADQNRTALPWSWPSIRLGPLRSAMRPVFGSRYVRAHPVMLP